MSELEFKSNGDGTCEIIIPCCVEVNRRIFTVPEKSPDGDKVISFTATDLNLVQEIYLPETFMFGNFFALPSLRAIHVDPKNPYLCSYDGILFDKKLETLISFPSCKIGKYTLPRSVCKVASNAFGEYCKLDEAIFQEGLTDTEAYSIYGPKIITLPASLIHIDEKTFYRCFRIAFDFEKPLIRAPKNSAAHLFAVAHNYKFKPLDSLLTWDAESWLEKFHMEGADYHALRCEVWENTRAIVEDKGYILPDGNSVLLTDEKRYSQFYYKPFFAFFGRINTPPEITVTAEDCLNAAHKWINDGLEVSVLNMASRRNPGGGVTSGAGAQEEYLFRCSDYYKFLYRYAHYAEQYGVTLSHYQYPLDRNFGGIFSKGVTIFRENEETGYRLTDKPWKVNMIAVAGMNSPRLVIENGEERIAPELVEGVKNKIRTIFRIACDQGQKNLVLGAIGCGAFHNPPKHVAELFRDVLCEHEFFDAFQKICFAVKTSHTSKGDTNFSAFKDILDGFIPTLKADSAKTFENPIKKIVIARDHYALLKTNGKVEIVDIHTGKSRYSQRFQGSIDIAAGFHHIIGLHLNGEFIFKSVGSQAPKHHPKSSLFDRTWFGGIAVDACEGHSAMLRRDGTVLCYDQYPMDTHTQNYRQKVEAWENIKQVALTFDTPYALTRDGKILRGDSELKDFQDATHGEIVQIAAFGCYYSLETVAALYADGTVKAWCDTNIEEVSAWRSVKKICCGLHAAVIGLTNDGKVLISDYCKYKDRQGNKFTTLENIVDVAMNFDHLVALNRMGEIICLTEDY